MTEISCQRRHVAGKPEFGNEDVGANFRFIDMSAAPESLQFPAEIRPGKMLCGSFECIDETTRARVAWGMRSAHCARSLIIVAISASQRSS
ncbi:hypothetical protein PYV50_16140 [Pseudomonas sp. H22_DOA]|nr:hypothetical protein PYV50_16140 [Pseudomonas sp. H22_DOA]